MKKEKSALLNISFGIGSHITKIILQFMSRTVFIFTLGGEVLGINSLFTSILSILSMTELGINSAIAYTLYEPIESGDNKKIASIINWYKRIYKVVGISIAFLGTMILPFINYITDIKNNTLNLQLIFILFIVKTSSSYLLFSYSQTLMIAAKKKYIVDKIDILFYLLTNVIEVFILLLTKNYILYLIIQIIFSIIQQYYIYTKVTKEFPYIKKNKNENLTIQEKKNIWKNVYGLSISRVSGSILSSVDNIVISTYISTSIVGIYSNYNMIVAAATGILSKGFTSITANIGSRIVKNEDIENLFYKILYINFILCGLMVVLFYNLVNDFMEIWLGDEYILENTVNIAISLNIAISYISLTVSTFKDASGVFWFGRYRPLITVILNIVLSIVLVKLLGISGVVLATAISRIMTTLWMDPYILYKYKFKGSIFKYLNKLLWYLSTIAIATIVSSSIANIMFGDYITIVTIIIKSVVVSLISIFIFVMLTIKDLNILNIKYSKYQEI